jgi:hypothetical protein
MPRGGEPMDAGADDHVPAVPGNHRSRPSPLPRHDTIAQREIVFP